MRKTIILLLAISCFCGQANAREIFGRRGLKTDSVGTKFLDDGSDTPAAGECVIVATPTTQLEYGACGGGAGDSITVNGSAVDTTANFKDNTEVTWTLTDGGAGGPDDVKGVIGTIASSKIIYDGTETVEQILDETLAGCVLDAIVLSDDGGLSVSWGSGEVFDRPNATVVAINANSGSATNNAITFLVWTAGAELALQATRADESAGEVNVGHFHAQDGDIIITPHTESTCNTIQESISEALANILEIVVTEGLVVSEHAGGAAFDLDATSGTHYHDGHEGHTTAAIDSTVTNFLRHFHTASAWDTDTNAEIDEDFWDNGTQKTANDVAKYYRTGVYVSDGGTPKMHVVYPDTAFLTLNGCLVGANPATPPGLEGVPAVMAICMKGNATALPAAGADAWIDIRPMINTSSPGTVTDHGNLAGLADDDHALYENELTNSAGLLGALDDETGTGLAVFNISPTFETSILGNYLTASEILITDVSKNIISASVATYPSLAELAYVKGVTSAIQTQIDTKGAHAGQVWTGTHDYGGATTFEIPQDKTTAVEGQITVDGTTGQFRYHGNAAQRTITYKYEESITVENIAAADDSVPFGSKSYARTVIQVGCRCIGTCTTKAEFSFSDSASNAFTLAATPTCATTGAATYQNVTGGGALIAGEGMLFNVTNAVNPETDWYEIMWVETVTAD